MLFADWKPERRRAFFLGLLLLLLFACALSALLLPRQNPAGRRIARVTQNGSVVAEIDLTAVLEVYTLRLNGENGAYNIIEVRPGSIGVIEASCPDKLCVHMGLIHDAGLIVTCLPNRVVIQIVAAA